MGKVGTRIASSSSHSSSSISTLGLTRGGSLCILTYQSILALLHLVKPTAFGNLGVESFKPSLNISSELCISSCYISVKVSGRKYHRPIQTSASSFALLHGGSWLPTAHNMFEDIPYQCPIIKDLITEVSVG